MISLEEELGRGPRRSLKKRAAIGFEFLETAKSPIDEIGYYDIVVYYEVLVDSVWICGAGLLGQR